MTLAEYLSRKPTDDPVKSRPKLDLRALFITVAVVAVFLAVVKLYGMKGAILFLLACPFALIASGIAFRRLMLARRGGQFLLILFVVSPLLFIAFSLWLMDAHGVPASKITQLRVGMSTSDVRRLLGNPSEVYEHPDGHESWSYTRATWCEVLIHLSPKGRVVGFDHDH